MIQAIFETADGLRASTTIESIQPTYRRAYVYRYKSVKFADSNKLEDVRTRSYRFIVFDPVEQLAYYLEEL